MDETICGAFVWSHSLVSCSPMLLAGSALLNTAASKGQPRRRSTSGRARTTVPQRTDGGLASGGGLFRWLS